MEPYSINFYDLKCALITLIFHLFVDYFKISFELVSVVSCKSHWLQESFLLSFVLYGEEYLWNRFL